MRIQQEVAIRKPRKEASEETTRQHLDLGLLASRTMRRYISVVEGPHIYGVLLWQPVQMNTGCSKNTISLDCKLNIAFYLKLNSSQMSISKHGGWSG